MNDMHHTDEPHKRSLPPEVEAVLAQESNAEQALLQETWTLADAYLKAEPSDAIFERLGADIWQNLEAAIQAEAATAQPATAPLRLVKSPLRLVRTRSFQWSAMAACVALLIAVGFLLRGPAISYTAPLGETAHVELPDGSQIDLNSGSTLTLARAFGEESRTVQLEGEAFFRVNKASEPFVVRTFNGSTTVLGTEFNVRARRDDSAPSTVVAVESGVVRVAARNADDTVTLQAGESAQVMNKKEAPKRVEGAKLEHALAWRTGDFKFAAQPLGTVIQEVERRFDVDIAIHSPHLSAEPTVLLLENPLSVEEILNDICEYNGCEYRKSPGGFEIIQPEAP